MHSVDWVVLMAYFAIMVGIGIWAKKRVKNTADFFTAGGKIPWWLSGISHHMSGYSAAVFVGYAAIAYSVGFALYVWWAIGITIACVVCAALFAPRWPRLRQKFAIVSPLEYLATRYNLPTQQIMAWSGALLKVFDVAAKWTASAVILNVFAGIPLVWGILLTGGVTLIYATVGGLWADLLTDFGQFVIQFIAGITMFVVVVNALGGLSGLFGMWDKLPASHSAPFSGQYSLWFFVAYIFIDIVSYSGGTWNLAQRFIGSPNSKAATRASLLSAGLYLIWPLILFTPMWAAPLFFPDLTDPSESYALLATSLLPVGLVGLVLAGMFSHTMAMTSSDANAISAVVVRDILPVLTHRRDFRGSKAELAVGRVCTLVFIGLSMIIALTSDSFGGVLGLLIAWFGALIGPIAIPMLLGMLPWFRRCGSIAALTSWAAGLITFALTKYVFASEIAASGNLAQAISVAMPILVSFIVYTVSGIVHSEETPSRDRLIDALKTDAEPGQDPVAFSEVSSAEAVASRS